MSKGISVNCWSLRMSPSSGSLLQASSVEASTGSCASLGHSSERRSSRCLSIGPAVFALLPTLLGSRG